MGIFDQVSGVVIGNIYGFDTDKQYDKEGKQIFFENIFHNLTKKYTFPILKIYEAGHKCASTFLPIGGQVTMDADNLSFSITEEYLS